MELNSIEQLKQALQENEKLFLLIFKSGSEQSDCAHDRVVTAGEHAGIPVYFADVNNVKDIHTAYGITTAPSLLEFSGQKLRNVIRGCQAESYYASALSGTGFASVKNTDGKPVKRVTVYTTPTCTWCNTIKTYFTEKNINFTEVNVAADPARAEEMVKKSGQQGVPQTDINGQVIVGFDKKRINELLEIR
jgi:glutaredoxin-like YruB-family protein